MGAQDHSPTRRTVLATSGAVLAGSLAGCFGPDDDEADPEQTEPLSVDTDHTLVSFDEEITGWVRSVSHDPTTPIAIVEGAIDVAVEQDYRVRLGIVDEHGVVLADTVETTTLFPVGTNTLAAEFDDLDDCESCFSGLLQVNYPEGQHPFENGEGEDDGDEQESGDEEDATDDSNDGDIDDTADSATIETDDGGTRGGD